MRWLFGRGGMKRTLLVPFIILLVAGFGASWLLYVTSSRKAVLSVVDAYALSSAERAAERVEAFLERALDVAETNVAFVRAFPNAASELPALRRALHFQLLERPEIDIVSVGFADGAYAEAERLADGRLRTGSAGLHSGGALVLERVDEEGNPVAVELRREHYDPRERPWYRRAVASASAAWTAPYAIASSGELAMAAVAAAREGGRVLGVASATVRLGSISGFLERVAAEPGARALILDESDCLVALTSATRARTNTPSGTESVAVPPAAAADPQRLCLRDLPQTTQALVTAASRESGRAVRVVSAGEAFRSVVIPLGGRLGLAWRLVLALPEAGFVAPLKRTDRIAAHVLGLMLAASIALAFFTAHRVTLPLRMLGAALGAYIPGGAESLGQQTGALADRPDEIGRLARSFAALAQRLDRYVADLEHSLAEKEVLLREVHHRVKNNMQIVSSLARLQAGEVQDPAAGEGYERLQERIQAMAFVHEDVYQSGSFEAVDMDHYLGRIAESLCGYCYGPDGGPRVCSIDVSLRGEGLRLGLDRAMPCGLIANELVANAVKHAFVGRSTGRVCLSLRREGADCVLRVEDDGVGLPASADPAMPPRRSGGGEGIGGSLIQGLVAQLRGTVRFYGSEKGTQVEVRFPFAAP